MMEAKKQLIRIEGIPSEKESTYSKTSLHFAFVTSPAQGRKQVTQALKCREFLNESVRNALRRMDGTGYSPMVGRNFDPTRTRLLLVQDLTSAELDPFKQRLFNGKACLNLLENLAGWDRSTITTVKHDIFKNTWLLTGPPEWISQPQLLSAASWVLRLASKYGPLAIDNYDRFEANVREISQKGLGTGDATSFAAAFWNKMYVLVKHRKEVFGDMSMEEAWCLKEDVPNFSTASGFYSFCVDSQGTYSEKSVTLKKKFKECCVKYLPRDKK